MHSVRIELAKLVLVGTRITYQATGDAGIGIAGEKRKKKKITHEPVWTHDRNTPQERTDLPHPQPCTINTAVLQQYVVQQRHPRSDPLNHVLYSSTANDVQQ